MNREERLSWLLEILARTGRIDVESVARESNMSSATIRRDLDHLESQQMLARTHGGAVANSVAYDLPLRYKVARHATEKQRIGAAAAELVLPGAVIGLNGGTTTTEVARALAGKVARGVAEGSKDARDARAVGVTVVTNAVNIANELTVRPNVKILVTGGTARAQTYELVGPLAVLVINELQFDLAVIGVDGLDVNAGATADNEDEADINRLMASRARRVVVVADSTKFGRRAFAHICPLSAIDVLITDTGTSSVIAAEYAAQGIDVRRV